MLHKLQTIMEYPAWYLTAKNRHGIHSPFLYKFLDECLYSDSSSGLFIDIEKERRRLSGDSSLLTYNDPGAGSSLSIKPRNKPLQNRSVARIAATSLKAPRYGRLFNRMIQYFGYKRVLEMGTSLGITTAYLGRAGQQVKVFTIEGAEPVADKASEVFNNLGCKNINLIRGDFESQLPVLVEKEEPFDMVFLDGDHKGEKVLSYFELLVKHIAPRGVVVIDDIRWSSSMKEAWKQIASHPEVRLSVDMFFAGMVFFNPDLSREHFNIRF